MIRLIATLICLTLISPVMAAAETRLIKVKMGDLVYRDGLFFQKFTDSPFTGCVCEGLDQGGVLKGKRQGKWAFYHDNGQLKWRGNYKNGYREGEWTLYDVTGGLLEKGKFEQGKKEGLWKIYSGGVVSHEDEYKHGDRKSRVVYFENGSIQLKASYKSGKLNGPYILYFENGRDIKAKGNYKDGKRDGYWEFFDTPGKKRLEGYLYDPTKDNIFGSFFEKPEFREGSGIYKDGKKISP